MNKSSSFLVKDEKLTISRKQAKISTVNCKNHHLIETLVYAL